MTTISLIFLDFQQYKCIDLGTLIGFIEKHKQ